MLRRLLPVLLLPVLAIPSGDRPPAAHRGGGTSLRSRLSALPLAFVPHRDGSGSGVRFTVRGAGAAISFLDRGLALALPDGARRYVLDLAFAGARPATPVGEGRTDAVVSDLTGRASTHRSRLPAFRRIRYREPWPGVDLVFSGTGRGLKYVLRASPGADVSRARFAWRGATSLRVTQAGALRVGTPVGPLTDLAPVSYQPLSGRRMAVPTDYDVNGRTYGFQLGGYDRGAPIVVDPVLLLHAGFLGGGAADTPRGLALGDDGSIYLGGETLSDQTTFPDGDPDTNDTMPAPGFDQTYNGSFDGFVAKLNPAGTTLQYATYIGGSAGEEVNAVAVDSSGSAYVAGDTGSDQTTFPDGDPDTNDTFPAPGFDQTHNGGTDAFVAKLTPAGTALSYATYIGGSGTDVGTAIAVDGSGKAYVAGSAASDQTTFPDGDPDTNDTFPVSGFDQTYNGSTRDVFVAKLDAAGTALEYATYVGGGADDLGHGIAADAAGNAYVVGDTASDQGSFPDGTDTGGNGEAFDGIPGFDQTLNGSFDAFVVKLTSAGTALSYGSYLGGGPSDGAYGIALDDAGGAYVSGYTGSDETSFPDGDPDTNDTMPAPGFDQTYNGGIDDAFAVRLDPSGTALSYATYVGGSLYEDSSGIAVDPARNAYVIGTTYSNQTTFPDGDGFGAIPGFDQSFNGTTDDDAYVVKLTPAGTGLVAATYLGGSGYDSGTAIAVGPGGGVTAVGSTESDQTEFPDGDGFGGIPGFDQTFNGTTDGFVVGFQTTEVCQGKPVTLLGGPDPDTLTGTGAADVVLAGSGADDVGTKGGKDKVCAGDGNDDVSGGGGNDRLKGEAGKDDLNGGSGTDVCDGGPGKDTFKSCERKKSL